MSYYSGAIASKSLISSFTGVKEYLFSRLYFTYAHIGSSKFFSINNAHNGLSRLDYWISWSIHPWANRWIKVPSYGLCIKMVDGFFFWEYLLILQVLIQSLQNYLSCQLLSLAWPLLAMKQLRASIIDSDVTFAATSKWTALIIWHKKSIQHGLLVYL